MTRYGQDAIDYWNDKQKRNKLIKKVLGIVLVVVVAGAALIHYTS